MNVRRHLQIVASDGQPVEDTCFHRTNGLRRTEELGLDQADNLFLRLFRILCVNLFCDGDNDIATAHTFAVDALGEERGTLVLSQTIDLIYAIRAARKSDFAFMPPDCRTCSLHISDEEWDTVLLIRAARQGDSVAVMKQAGILTEGRIMIGVGLAARGLGEQFAGLVAS
jgi:hypothetical protein